MDLFDPQLDAGNLTDQDLADLRFFGVNGALSIVGEEAPNRSAAELLRHLEARLERDPVRLKRAGIDAYLAVGVFPRGLPKRGLAEVLARLPALLGAPRVVALGPVGLEHGGADEEHALTAQLELAMAVRRPVLIHTPVRDKARLTRRTLVLLREREVSPSRVLVTRVDARTVRVVREFGFSAALMVHPARVGAEQSVRLVRRLGAENLMLASDVGAGPGDLLALPRAVMLLEKAGLSKELVSRVTRRNARTFLGLSP